MIMRIVRDKVEAHCRAVVLNRRMGSPLSRAVQCAITCGASRRKNRSDEVLRDGLRFEVLPGAAVMAAVQSTQGGTASRPALPTPLQLVSRIAASLLGGFGFVWGFNALGTVLGVAAGLPYGDAQSLVYLFAFLVFVAAFCWAFAARSQLLVWGVLGGGGATMTLLAWLGLRAL
jgi:hypothetical protein